MNEAKKDYEREFDDIVNNYNAYLSSAQKPEINKKRAWHAFLRGMCSAFNIFGSFKYNPLAKFSHPLYNRDDLSLEQIDSVALASDWKRAGASLDEIIAGKNTSAGISLEQAKMEKTIVAQMYAHFKQTYLTYAGIKKHQ